MEERRFCTSCGSLKAVEGGAMFSTKKSSRWKCKWCIAKLSPSVFASKSKGIANGNK